MPTRKMKDSFAGTALSRTDRLLYLQQQQRTKTRDVSRIRASVVSPIGDKDMNPLQQAVFRGCIECIRVLVETPPYHSVNRPCGPDGLRPLHIASREGHIHVLRYLSSAGASVEKCDVHGSSGLHHAALGGQLRSTRWLLRHGAQITLDKLGWTPIQVAKEHGYTEIVTLLTNHSSCGTLNLMPSTLSSESPNSQRYSSSSTEHNNSVTPSNTTTILIAANDHKTKTQQKRGNQNYRNDDCCGGVEGKVTQIHQDSSSSGNSSLVTIVTSSVSNSPSSLSSSTTICDCSCSSASEKSDENERNDFSTTTCGTVVKIGPAVSRLCEQESESNLIPLSFYLHPPQTSVPVTTSPRPRSSAQNIQEVIGHITVEPFYLHPPPILKDQSEDSLNEIPLVIPAYVTLSSENSNSVHFKEPPIETFKMAPVAPMNSTSDYLSTKEKKEEEKCESSPTPSTSGSTSSTPPPPPPKTGRVQALRSAIALDSPVPPPPPPPMPKFEHKGTLIRHSSINGISALLNRLNLERTNAGTPCENDYEDIDEMHGGEAYYEEATLVTANATRAKLNRSISAPPLPIGVHLSHSAGNGIPEPPPMLIQPKGVPAGIRRPFIPPNFPDPPKDALIKPSEYLKSIQQSQSKKLGKGPTNVGGTLGTLRTSSNRIEEVIKLLNGTEMSVVPEESATEDELQELNQERRSNSAKGRSPNFDEDPIGGGGIKPEELMKVNLRKTTMSRTLSAPVIGRVLPDLNGSGSQDVSPFDGKAPTLNKNNGKSTINLTPSTRAAIIAELAESSQVGGVREWKEELRRRQLEEEKAAANEIASIYSPLNFVAEDLYGQIPSTDGSGTPIPPWKRQMMAKKAAEKAKKEAEEQRKLEAEAKRESAIPPWKRQLMQRRDSDGKGAQ